MDARQMSFHELDSVPDDGALPSGPIMANAYPNAGRAWRLRELADSLYSQIEDKLHPAIAEQNPTPRRARIAARMEREGRQLQEVQASLYALADAWDAGEVPMCLVGIRYKSEVEVLVIYEKLPHRGKVYARMKRAGIEGNEEFQEAKAALAKLTDYQPGITDTELKIRRLERELIGIKIPGFFPTPTPVVDRMLGMARIQDGMRVLEPSAGKGDIAAAIRAAYDVQLDVVEINQRLRKILELKGFDLAGRDFMEYDRSGYDRYDRIVMNPPFENGQDVDHVRHAFQLLKAGGRLVGVVSESPFSRTDRQYPAFREWLGRVGRSVKLPDRAFRSSGTGVSARLVVTNG